MNIKYKIKFYSDWHCGSGLSSGADLDLLVIKDKDDLPFVPGKTIKGLVREAVEELNKLNQEKLDEVIKKVFGVFDTKENAQQGCCFFTNATIEQSLGKAIVNRKLQAHLYRTVASTAIDEEGVAVEHSLRKMQVTIPCELEGEILLMSDCTFEKDESEQIAKMLERGMKFIKRLGQNRNRGLGRCSFENIQWEGKEAINENS